jgi:hypothetical protein
LLISLQVPRSRKLSRSNHKPEKNVGDDGMSNTKGTILDGPRTNPELDPGNLCLPMRKAKGRANLLLLATRG